MLGFLFAHFYHNPKDVKAIFPRIVNVLNLPEDMSIAVESVHMQTDFDRDGFILLTIKGLTLTNNKLGKEIFSFPEIQMNYGLRALLRLDYRPNVLEIDGAKIDLIRNEQGHFYVQNVTSVTEPESIQDVSKEEMETSILGHVESVFYYLFTFKQVVLENATITVEDSINNSHFVLENTSLLLQKKGRNIHLFKGNTKLKNNKFVTVLSGQMALNHKTHQVPFQLKFDDLNLAMLQGVLPEDFPKTDMVLSGEVIGQADFLRPGGWQNWIQQGTVDIRQHSKGQIILPTPIDKAYRIQDLLLSLKLKKELEGWDLTGTAMVEGVPTQIVAEGILSNYWKTKTLKDMLTLVKIKSQKIPIESLKVLWPKALVPVVHTWIQENMEGGLIPTANFNFAFMGLGLTKLYGEVAVEGSKVSYLGELPPIQGAKGMIYLTPTQVDIKANQGKVSGGVDLIQAHLKFYDLDTDKEQAYISLKTAGPLSGVLALLEQKPLELTKNFGVDPKDTHGETVAETVLMFPLSQDLSPQQVKVKVLGTLTQGQLPLPIQDKILQDITCQVAVTEEGMEIQGSGVFETIPLQFEWKEKFTGGPVHSVYKISAEPKVENLVPFWADITEIAKGKLGFDLFIQNNNNDEQLIDIKANLKNASINIFPINYEKALGQDADLHLRLDNLKKGKNCSFDLKNKKGLLIEGTASFDPDFALTFKKIKSSENDLSASLRLPKKGGIYLQVKGKKWDATKLMDNPLSKKTPEPKEFEDIKNLNKIPQPLHIDIALDKLTLAKDFPFTPVHINIQRQGYLYKKLDFYLQGKDRFYVRLNEKNRLVGGTENLGDILKRLGWTDRLLGGIADITGKQERQGGIKADIELKNMTLKDSGFLTQALTILGIIDAFQGKELEFTEGEIPLELTPQQSLFIKDGYIAGRNLGITFEGRLSTQKVALSGSVIPAYAINSLPGKIPVIGALFRDSNKGGIFGVKYDVTGTPANRTISFHPLSSVAPGILGRFLK